MLKLKQQAQQGFTLIELMIVIAIIGILAAVAFPAYQDYVKRAQVITAFAHMRDIGNRGVEYWIANGRFPPSEQNVPGVDFWLSQHGTYYVAIDINMGGSNPDPANTMEIILSVTDKIYPGGVLSLRATLDAKRNVIWTCGQMSYDNIPNEYLPPNCRR